MLNVVGVEAFSDNYIWVVQDESGLAAIVDPGDEEPVIEYLEQSGVQPAAILITHKHGDHVGGIQGLKARYSNIQVYGPADEPIRHLDVRLRDGDCVEIPGMSFQPAVMSVPGHTEGHIAYHDGQRLFCGDTLFACGCGRVFSGTMHQLYESLQRINRLPGETQVYCAHEYTLDNIGFAKWVEPENPDLLHREQQDQRARTQGHATVPSLLSLEQATNPFLRAHIPGVKLAAEKYAGKPLENPEAVFTCLRQWKDREYD